jgi:hypothetical protein
MTLTHRTAYQIHNAFTVWKQLKSNWIVSLSEKFVFLLFLVSMALLLWQWKNLPPLVPLWYDKSWGTEQLADPHWLFILPFSSIIIFLINVIISVYLVSEYLVFTQMASLSSLLISILSAITLMKIIFLIH